MEAPALPYPSPAAAPLPVDVDVEAEETTPSARAALAQAESDYQQAAVVLEAQVGARQGHAAARRNRALGRARLALSSAHPSERDPRAGVRLLAGYSSYLKSLRRELDEPRAGRE